MDEVRKKSRVSGPRALWREMKRNLAAYLFLSPFILLFLVFLVFPIGFSFYVSFFDWPGIGAREFIGLDNYRLLFIDPQIQKALWTTLLVGIGHVIPTTFLALTLAVLLNHIWLRLSAFWQLAIFLPSVTAAVVIALVFDMLLDTQFGSVNGFLASLGIPAISWLDDPFWAKVSLAGIVNWRWTGYNTLIVLAGLKGIRQDVYDAATVDGANGVQQLLFITLPLLRPVLLFISVTSTIGILQLFEESYILTPSSAPTLGLYLYQTAFGYFKFGYGSAIAYFITALVLVLALLQLRFFGREVD